MRGETTFCVDKSNKETTSMNSLSIPIPPARTFFNWVFEDVRKYRLQLLSHGKDDIRMHFSKRMRKISWHDNFYKTATFSKG